MRALLLVSILLAGTAGLFAEAEDVTAGISQMASDGKGRIFAFDRSWSDKLIVFEEGRWKEVPLSPADKPAEPRGLLSLRDGRVASVWTAGKGEWVLAIVEGNRIAQRLSFSWSLDSGDFFAMVEDSQGRIWLTGRMPEVVRCDPAAGTSRILDLAPLYVGPENKNWNRVFLTEDLRGGLWLWTENQASNCVSIPRPVRVRGDSLELLPDIPGYTGRQLVSLRVRDKDSLWIGTSKEGLFILSLETLSAEPVPEPEKNAFNPFIKIFPFGSGWLVLSGAGSRMRLWELIDGKWTCRVPPYQFKIYRGYPLGPVYLDMKSGAVLPSENGILFIPHNGESAKLIDWRHGWTLAKAEQFLSLGGDRFAAWSNGGNPPWWAVADLNDVLAPQTQSEAVEILPWCAWTVDSRDRIFTLLKAKSTVLDIWENGSWREVPLPKELKNDMRSHVEVDSQNRVWVFCEQNKYPVGILSSDLKTWETQPDYQSALAKHCEDMDGFAKDRSSMRPITGPHGQIAFQTEVWKIAHWDGSVWKTYDLPDIGSFSKDDRMSTPFFDAEGRLCVNTKRTDKTWKLGGDQKWTAETKIPGLPDRDVGGALASERQKLPDDFVPKDIRKPWIATDNLGVTWVAGNSNLYKFYNGRTVAIFDGKAVHPFLRNPKVQSVRVDRFGNTWFQLDSNGHIMLPAKTQHLPSLSVESDRWGLAKLSSLPKGAIEWRLPRGNWEHMHPGGQELGFLPSGDHEIKFRILTDELDVIGPISKKLSISISSAKQLDHLITILRDGPDSARESAIAGLARQPAAAVSALKSAIKSGDCWWLDAALQELERQQQKNAASPPSD